MANTGVVIVLTLKELQEPGNIPTGNTKPNSLSDPDYIPPYTDLSHCPITYNTTCPTVIATGQSLSIFFEFYAPNTVIKNTTIAGIKMKAKVGSSTISSVTFPLPNPTQNYFGGTLTGLSASTSYTLEVDYLNSSNVVIHTCPSLFVVSTL